VVKGESGATNADLISGGVRAVRQRVATSAPLLHEGGLRAGQHELVELALADQQRHVDRAGRHVLGQSPTERPVTRAQ
jgi:hypothetical protein